MQADRSRAFRKPQSLSETAVAPSGNRSRGYEGEGWRRDRSRSRGGDDGSGRRDRSRDRSARQPASQQGSQPLGTPPLWPTADGKPGWWQCLVCDDITMVKNSASGGKFTATCLGKCARWRHADLPNDTQIRRWAFHRKRWVLHADLPKVGVSSEEELSDFEHPSETDKAPEDT